jgi:alpha-tubulin suppressor-like RCC1 family protein
MISTKTIIDKANEKITAGLTEDEVLRLSVIDDSITKSKLVVATVGDLPSAADNRGRLVYVSGTDEYYFSDGTEWLSDYTSAVQILSATGFSWGRGLSGQRGDGVGGDKSSPVTVVGGITNWSQVSASTSHSLGLTDTGIAYAWGSAFYGQLGDGARSSRSSPVTVVGGITNWSQVSASTSHSLGVTDTGIAYSWGRGSYGRLGDGTIINRSSPVTVVGGITNWSQLSSGAGHSLGLTSDGVAYAWGLGGSGRLGDGTTINRSSPVTVVGGITNWSQLSAGGGHSLGLTSDGVAYAWGFGNTGQLGDGTTVNRSSPVTVVGGITNWSQVSAGFYHSLGVTDTGIAYAWGRGNAGRLGDGTIINRSSPATVVGGITNWSSVSAGTYHSLGVTDTGIAYAWGQGIFGRLGDGTKDIDRSSPVTVVGGIANWSQVSAGGDFSLAISTQEKGFNEP